jgi:signal transduction histidine kinase
MLDHLKLEGGAVRPEMSAFQASDLFDRVLLTQGPAASAEGLRITTVGGRAPLYGDILLLARAVENLVANAIRHSGGRRILLGARTCRAETWIWVIDDGRGLGDGDLDRIFTPFEQGAHVGPAGGFGLGLAATRELATLMGGSCGVRRDIARGSAFWISLPARIPDAQPQDAS